ncbi:peptide transporter family 1 isoform X2 [Leptinotarsa decemlineata]|uniref:peptide transporter family 1 isoform X2 n=1 Tax=Leptinotarsa decemlineata TaxID=7539 RepID=UPI003D307047
MKLSNILQGSSTSQEPKNSFQDTSKDEEAIQKKLPYPKSVFFIICNEFCERFNYYGMRTILVLYLTDILLYSNADAKIIYHSFTMFAYFFPVLGAILSDSYLGKFRTILYVSMIYAVGSILLALTAIKPLNMPQKGMSILGLLLIAVGTGGIKPCVSAFGGDQFILPQQETQLALFFSFFYFSINAGSLISTSVTPILRQNVHCFGENSCFSLAFALPGVLMVVSIVLFGLGKPLYKVKKPGGNVIVDVTKCITYAIGKKIKSKEKKEHWLDFAEDKYGVQLVTDIKSTLNVLVLYIPLPIFWALYDQQGSGWTFQAVRMDGDIGFYTILPDQFQVVNPLLILAFIPIFSYWVYPLLSKCNLLKTPLQRMAAGGLLAAVAFAVSALVSIALENTDPVLPSAGNIQLRIYNPSPCSASFYVKELNLESPPMESMDYYEKKDIDLMGNTSLTFQLTLNCLNGETIHKESKENVEGGNSYGIYFGKDAIHCYLDEIAKSEDGFPRVRTLDYSADENITYIMDSYSYTAAAGNNELLTIDEPGDYKYGRQNGSRFSSKFLLGGIYTVMLSDNHSKVITVTEPNSVHMLWLLPQYFIITGAEIMFSITGLEFSYSQAPSSMKSLMQACWLLTTAFGNLIIVIIESAKIFDKQSNDFFLYTGLMVVDIILFAFLAMKYKYVQSETSELEELKDTNGDDHDEKIKNGLDNPTYKEK